MFDLPVGREALETARAVTRAGDARRDREHLPHVRPRHDPAPEEGDEQSLQVSGRGDHVPGREPVRLVPLRDVQELRRPVRPPSSDIVSAPCIF